MTDGKPAPETKPAQEDPRAGHDHDDSWRERVSFGGGSMHESFEQQIRRLLADSDVSEEDKERILTNMSCPCCGGSAASFTVKLKD